MVVALRYAAKLPAGGDLMQLNQLIRRDFITLLGGAAGCGAGAARGEDPEGWNCRWCRQPEIIAAMDSF